VDQPTSASKGVPLESWPDESKEASQLEIDAYGEPHEASESQLIWNRAAPEPLSGGRRRFAVQGRRKAQQPRDTRDLQHP